MWQKIRRCLYWLVKVFIISFIISLVFVGVCEFKLQVIKDAWPNVFMLAKFIISIPDKIASIIISIVSHLTT